MVTVQKLPCGGEGKREKDKRIHNETYLNIEEKESGMWIMLSYELKLIKKGTYHLYNLIIFGFLWVAWLALSQSSKVAELFVNLRSKLLLAIVLAVSSVCKVRFFSGL